MKDRAEREERYRDTEARLWRSYGLVPTEQCVRLDRTGSSIRVQEVGSGPPVIFVHGTSNSGSSWVPLVAGMGEYRCIVLDRPGCGLSEPLGAPFAGVADLEVFADWFIADVLDALGLDKAFVVATSFGGFIALRSAAAHPERIERMVEFGYLLGAPIDKIPLLMRLGSVAPLGRAMGHLKPTRSMIPSILRQAGLDDALKAGAISDEFIDWFLAVVRDTDTIRNELTANPRVITPIRGLNRQMAFSEDLLAGIETPAKFIWGSNDLFGGENIARRFTAMLPNGVLDVMAGAGHAPWIDDPKYATASARSFLQ